MTDITLILSPQDIQRLLNLFHRAGLVNDDGVVISDAPRMALIHDKLSCLIK